jgi:putative transposase
MVTPIAQRSVSEAAAASGSRGRRRGVVEHLRAAYRVSERRACRATGFHRSSQRHRARRDPRVELRMRLEEPAAARVRCGYRRPHVPLRREGRPIDAKRVHRLCREEGLSIRPKVPRRRRSCRYRAERPAVVGPNECRAMDFLSDQLFDGRPFRILAVIDGHTRESLATVPRTSFRAFRAVEVLDRLAAERGRPRVIKVDNGPGFAGKMLDRWARPNRVELDFSRPGEPADNAHVEAFDARFGRGARTPRGPCRWPTRGTGSRPGGGTATGNDRTPPSGA